MTRAAEAKQIATDLEEFADERMSEWERVMVRDVLSTIESAEEMFVTPGITATQLEKLESLQERYL